MKKLIALTIAIIIIILPLNSFTSYAENEPIFGIDVSRWQGEIDWIEVKNNGVNFAILRAYSYGEDYNFQEYYSGAVAAGLDVGAYSYTYAENLEEAVEEANDLVAVLGKRKFQYPIFIDIEDPFYQSVSKKDLTTQIVLTELQILRDAGYYAAIYSGKYFADTYLDLTKLYDYDMWIAQYNDTCTYTGDYTMWQYSDSGSVNGISGPVDTNYCYVNYPEIVANSGLNYLMQNVNFPCSGRVTADSLNVREGPNTTYTAITQISLDTNVTVNGVECVSGWYYISFTDSSNNYYTGYCSSEYIELQRFFDILGDVDLSGTVDVSDGLIVLQHTVKKVILPSDAQDCADVDRNGNINANDALLILQYSVGKITSFF